MRRILHPTDFSSASRPAFKKAVEMAKRSGAAVELLHVMSPAIPLYGGMHVAPRVHEEIEASRGSWVRKEMTKLLKTARAAGIKVRSKIVAGSPSDGIVREARALRADMIVIGTHGRTGIGRLLLGSVASRVIATSPCPVLAVRSRR